ncbi:coiled coil-containing protein [Cryptosporidium canis]|nr:coiled coil-containing protein [Cryptosporidium canis]
MQQVPMNAQPWGAIPSPMAGGIPARVNGPMFPGAAPRVGVFSTPHSPQRSNHIPAGMQSHVFPRQVPIPMTGMIGKPPNLGAQLTPAQELMMSTFTTQNQSTNNVPMPGPSLSHPLNAPPSPIPSSVPSPEREQRSTGIGTRLINSFIPWMGTCGAQPNGGQNSGAKSQNSGGIGSVLCCGSENAGIMTPDFPGSHDSNFSFSNNVKGQLKAGNFPRNDLEKENKELRESLFQLGEAVHDFVSKKDDQNNESQLIAALSKQLSTIHQKIGDLKYSVFPTNNKIGIETSNELVLNIVQSVNIIFGKIEVIASILSNDHSAIVFVNEIQKSLFEIGSNLEKLDEVHKSKSSELESAKHVSIMIEEDNKHLSDRLKDSNEQIRMLRERIIVLSANIEDKSSPQAQTSSPLYKKLEGEKIELEKKVEAIERQLEETKKALQNSENKYNTMVKQELINSKWPNHDLIKGRSHEDLVDLLRKIDPESKALQSIAENIVKKDRNTFVPQPTLRDRVLNVQVRENDIDFLKNDSNLGEIHKDTIRMQLEQFQKLHLINENVNKNTDKVPNERKR